MIVTAPPDSCREIRVLIRRQLQRRRCARRFVWMQVESGNVLRLTVFFYCEIFCLEARNKFAPCRPRRSRQRAQGGSASERFRPNRVSLPEGFCCAIISVANNAGMSDPTNAAERSCHGASLSNFPARREGTANRGSIPLTATPQNAEVLFLPASSPRTRRLSL